MVVGWLRPVGPPSIISGMRSPIWSRTQAAWVHSDVTLQVRRGGGNRQAECFNDGAGNGRIGDADGHIAGMCGDAQGELGAGADNDGERPGPELVGQPVEHGVGVARQSVGLCQRRNQQRQGLVLLTALDLVDLLDRGEVHGIDGQSIEGVGGHGDEIALVQAGHDVVDPVLLGLIGMDTQDFRGQNRLPRSRICRKFGSYHERGLRCKLCTCRGLPTRSDRLESLIGWRAVSRCLFALYRVNKTRG